MWQSAVSPLKAREKYLFILHPQTWSRKKSNSLGLYYFVTEPPTEKKNISQSRIKALTPQESSCSHTTWKGKFPGWQSKSENSRKKWKDAILPVELSVRPWSEKKIPCYNQPPRLDLKGEPCTACLRQCVSLWQEGKCGPCLSSDPWALWTQRRKMVRVGLCKTEREHRKCLIPHLEQCINQALFHKLLISEHYEKRCQC